MRYVPGKPWRWPRYAPVYRSPAGLSILYAVLNAHDGQGYARRERRFHAVMMTNQAFLQNRHETVGGRTPPA